MASIEWLVARHCQATPVNFTSVTASKGAFDGAGTARVGHLLLWRRRDQANDVKQAFGLERLRHADDGAELVAGGVIGRLSRAREKNYGNALEAFVALDDEAEVLAGHVFGFDFGDEDGGDSGLEDFEGFVRRGDDDNCVAVGLKRGAHDFGGPLIGFDGKNHGLLRLSGCGGGG